MVKIEDIESIERLLSELKGAIRASNIASVGEYEIINPITGERKKLKVTAKEKTEASSRLEKMLDDLKVKLKEIFGL